MIRFSARTDDGRLLIGLGLSAENVRRLKVGKPITFPLASTLPTEAVTSNEVKRLGDIHILIIYGETEADLKGQLAPLLGPGTEERYST